MILYTSRLPEEVIDNYKFLEHDQLEFSFTQ